MIQNPQFVYYACIAKGTTIVAEFNSKHADLGALAAKCLDNTPSLHSMFSHTIREKTYTFLIDHNFNFTYFGIFDDKFEKSEGVYFLNSVKDSFNEIAESNSSTDNLRSHCFQGEFNPVFHHLLASPQCMDSPEAMSNKSGSFDSPKQRIKGLMPMLENESTRLKKKKKKKKFSFGDNENKLNVFDDDDGKMRGFSDSGMDQQKAKIIWKKQVVIVLTVDLIVCCILFGIWLWICRGFKCINA